MIFLTSVLNASTNWILLRHVYSALKSHASPSTELVGGTAVLFISWLHGSDFWRDGARKLVCLERNPLTKPFRGTDLQIAYELHRTTSLDRAIFCLTEQSECAQGFNFPKTGKITFIDALHLDHGVKEVEDVLLKKIKEFETSNNRVLLVLDGIDFLLAGTEARLDEILGMIWELREVWRQPLY